MRLDRAVGDQLANRQRETLRRRTKLAVNLFDTKPWVFGDKGNEFLADPSSAAASRLTPFRPPLVT
jgi:hypothetical protein